MSERMQTSLLAPRSPGSLAVYYGAARRREEHQQWGPGLLDHYLLIQFLSGSGQYESAAGQIRFFAGDALLLYPNTECSFRPEEGIALDYLGLGFDGKAVPELLAATDFSPQSPVLTPREPAALTRRIQAAIQAWGMTAEAQLAAAGQLYLVFSLLSEQQASSSTDMGPVYVQRAVDFIARNYSHPMSVEDIAACAGISRSHLYRVFIQHFGISPNQYLVEYRIKKACVLLKQGDLPVAAVASSVGFEDHLYFSKVFRRIMQTTPTAYIRANRRR